MQQHGILYGVFVSLTAGVVIMLVLLFRYISPDRKPIPLPGDQQAPSDVEVVLEDLSARESWIYKLQLQRKQNIFSYPRTVYHINLN